MNIADAINPFLFRHDVLSTIDPATHLVASPGKATIISLLDELYVADNFAAAPFATVISDDYDIEIHGLDIVLACDFLHASRSANTSRRIDIFCRKLTVRGGKNGVTIDVSAMQDMRFAMHTQPDVARRLNNASEHASSGDDIAAAIDRDDAGDLWHQWFQANPGRGWARAGATGGSIRIACETLALESKLTLRANGAKGHGGIGGQNVSNWLPGLIGGAAGRGGPGGDSGTVELTCARSEDAKGNAVNLSAWVTMECDAGEPGDPGLPGAAVDPSQHNQHFGSYARSGTAGKSTGGSITITRPYRYQSEGRTVSVPDVSQAGLNLGRHYWALLYHRIKLAYLQAQPIALRRPRAGDPGWQALGKLIRWGSTLSLPYGDLPAELRQAFYADTSKDPEADTKDSLARALKLMTGWYDDGRTVWGTPAASVSPMPLETIFTFMDGYFQKQIGVRDFYIRLRKELDQAIHKNEDIAEMSNAAEYAVRLHEASVDALRVSLYGSTDAGGVDAESVLGSLNAANSACDSAIARLAPDLEKVKTGVQEAVGVHPKDFLEALKSMCFVAGDAKAALGMAVAEGVGLFMKAKDEITDNAGNSMAKSAVIGKVTSLEGDVKDLQKAVVGMVAAGDAGRLDQALLASANSIDNYVANFTESLGDIAKTVLDDVAALRQAVLHRNQLWMQYNNQLLQLAKEWEDYQACVARKQHIDKNPQDLSANLLDAVQLYTSIYLGNLERTADLRANMLRKFAYVTLGADLPSGDFIGSVSGFWDADRQAANAMAEQSDNNWDIARDTVIGGDNTTSIRSRLREYNAGTQSVVLRAPDKDVKDRKSRYYIDIAGDASERNRTMLSRLLAGHSVWISVTPPAGREFKYTDENGEPGSPPATSEGLFSFPMVEGEEWDMRVSHVTPWIEGIDTDSADINFAVRLSSGAYILDSNKTQTARLFDYNGSTVSTEFAHLKGAKVADMTLASIGGGGGGEVSDDNVDKRGVFTAFTLHLTSKNPRPLTDLAAVKLRIHFRVIFRAPKLFLNTALA